MKRGPGYSKKYDKALKSFLRLLGPKRRKKGCLILLAVVAMLMVGVAWVATRASVATLQSFVAL